MVTDSPSSPYVRGEVLSGFIPVRFAPRTRNPPPTASGEYPLFRTALTVGGSTFLPRSAMILQKQTWSQENALGAQKGASRSVFSNVLHETLLNFI